MCNAKWRKQFEKITKYMIVIIWYSGKRQIIGVVKGVVAMSSGRLNGWSTGLFRAVKLFCMIL